MNTAPQTDVAEPVKVARNPMIAVIALCFGGLAAALTQTMVIPIQSELPTLLDTSAGNASWVVTITLLTAGVAMPVAGRLGDLLGKQRVILASAVLLAAGSLVCALSDSLVPVLVGRGIQGLAMGFIPVGISLMRQITPKELTGTAIAAMSATLGVGGAIGLPLAAWIAQSGDWHLLFWVSVAAAVAVAVAVTAFVPHIPSSSPGSFDAIGAAGLAVGLVGVLVGVSKGNEWGWTDARTLTGVVGGLVVLLLWGWFELRRDEPLVDLRTTARPAVLRTNLAAVAIGFGMMAQSIVVPQLLQLPRETGFGLGQSILAAGLWMAPGGLMMLVFSPLSSRMLRDLGGRITLMVGASVLGVGYLVATLLMAAPWQLMVASLVACIGVAIGYAAMPTLILDNVPEHESGSAVGVNALARSIGTTVAAAVMSSVLTSQTVTLGGFTLPSESAFRWCFVIGAAAAFVGVALTATLPRRTTLARRAAETGAETEAETAGDLAQGVPA